MFSRKTHMVEVKNRIFKMMLVISMIAFWGISVINLMNRRPMVNFIYPFVAGFIMFAMFILYRKERWAIPIKYTYLVFLCFIYIPLSWLTSPGSYSAMPYYAILIFFVGVILAQDWWDYVFPFVSIVETIFFFYYEVNKPLQYYVYSEPMPRAVDLTINLSVVALIIFALLMVLNSYFDYEHKRIYKLSITDQLTGIYNRRYVYHELEHYERTEEQTKRPFTILMMDLNNFKKVNDTYGHAAGDEVLKIFGKVLNQASRKKDLPARYGGDEFMLILPDTSENEVAGIIKRIIDLFSPVLEQYQDIGLSVGFGVAESGGRDIESILQQADDHLYSDKALSKQRVVQDSFLKDPIL